MANLLAEHPDYRVLRRLNPSYAGGPKIIEGTVRRAAIVDVETTGMDPEVDRVIELGIVVFAYAAETGQVGSVVGHFDGFEDPGRPIPSEVTAIHGITDEMVNGQQLDESAIGELLKGVGIVIAHNAEFDRRFLEARLPLFAALPWGCSIRDVPWKSHGASSLALECLAYRAGFFYDGHRAEIDCRAVLAVLTQALGTTGQSALGALLEHARRPSFRVAALNSPFESKDALKEHGYRWNPGAKVWVREIVAAERATEFGWLKAGVYGGRSVEVELETVDARLRYSERHGKKETVVL